MRKKKESGVMYERLYLANKDSFHKIIDYVLTRPPTGAEHMDELPSVSENTLAFRLSPSWTIVIVLCLVQHKESIFADDIHWRWNCFLMNNVSADPLVCDRWTLAQKQSIAAVFKAFAEGCGEGGSVYHHRGNKLVGLKRPTHQEVQTVKPPDSEVNLTSQKPSLFDNPGKSYDFIEPTIADEDDDEF